MKLCLFCNASGPYSTVEHVIPESLGNDELILKGEVCDSCQAYFGTEIEHYVLDKTPLAFWRTFLRIKTKRGRHPSVDLSTPKKQKQQKKQKGVFPSVHPFHDDVGYTSHEDSSVSVEIYDDAIVRGMLSGDKTDLNLVLTPKVLHMLGRFFCKVGLELLCTQDPLRARSAGFDLARQFARRGGKPKLWPIFHFSQGSLSDFQRRKNVDGEAVEEVTCYSYSLADFRDRYTLFGFSMGTDNWIICLNDPYPPPAIQEAVPGGKLDLIWYADNEW